HSHAEVHLSLSYSGKVLNRCACLHICEIAVQMIIPNICNFPTERIICSALASRSEDELAFSVALIRRQFCNRIVNRQSLFFIISRSEERRVGKECRSRWSADQSKNERCAREATTIGT